MRIEDLNWMDVEKYLTQDDRIMVILGACEQHGYLSLLTDSKIPLALADAASQRSGVLVAPPLNFGCSPYFLKYPGTISLSVSTLLETTADIVRSVYNQGFHRILFLNGHGGNSPVNGRLAELANEFPQLRSAFYSWWQSPIVTEIAQRNGLKPAHANWLEAFAFTTIADLPKGEKIPSRVPGIVNAAEARSIYGDGSFGGAYHASPEVMQEIFEACLSDTLQLLQFE